MYVVPILINYLKETIMKIKKYFSWMVLSLMAVSSVSLTSCEDEPDKFELTGGVPTVEYIRPGTAAAADSLLSEASMGSTICLVGNNLTSIKELYFNDQKTILNTSYITDHTMLVSIPNGIPEKVSDKIYMITKGADTLTYDFHVVVPAPTVSSMSNEWAHEGDVVTINGDYFISDPSAPLTVTFEGGKQAAILSFNKTEISVQVPEGAEPGYINVESIYGKSKSKFQYHDTRNILFDFDGSHGGLTLGQGWRDGSKVYKNDEYGIDGGYLRFGGAEMSGDIGGTWAEDEFCLNYWPNGANDALSSRKEMKEMLDNYDLDKLQIKFEVCIPKANPWSSAALQIMFTGDKQVTMATAGNGFYSDKTFPRALWMPWTTSGSYDTNDQWTTVSIPLSSFNKTHEGQACENKLDKTYFTGLTFFVWHGGVKGTTCTPVICIDNIRVVPIE